MTATAEHSPFGPSSLIRRARCPGSYAEEQGVGELPREYLTDANEGTRLHELFAKYLPQAIESPDRMTYDIHEDLDDVVLIVNCLNFFLQHFEAGDAVYIEQRVEMPYGEGVFGTADVIIDKPDRQVVIDWKTHRQFPETSSLALQITAYLLAARSGDSPAIGYAYFPRLDDWVEVDNPPADAIDRLCKVVADCLVPDAKTSAGSHCQYCTAIATCDAATKRSESVLNLPAEVVERLPADSEELRTVWDLIPHVEAQAKAIKARVRSMLEQGADLPWVQLVEENGKRSASLGELWAVVKEHIGQAEFFAKCSVSVPAVEKEIIARWIDEATAEGMNLSTAAAKRKFAELSGEVVRQPRIKKLKRVKA